MYVKKIQPFPSHMKVSPIPTQFRQSHLVAINIPKAKPSEFIAHQSRGKIPIEHQSPIHSKCTVTILYTECAVQYKPIVKNATAKNILTLLAI